MAIKITSDSTCDLSPELLARYDIFLTPLYVIMDGKTYRDGVDIHPEDIFRHVDNGGKLCSTSAVNMEDYRECFARFSPQYDAVIHITIGSGFSTCYQNASIAAAGFPNVYVVDSQNLSSGQGHLVVEAAQLAEKGMSAVEIFSRLQEMRGRVAGEAARAAIEKYASFAEIIETHAGCTVSCHCGPGTLGVLFINE